MYSESVLSNAVPIKNRSAKYDNIKALLIFLVIFGHSLKNHLSTSVIAVFLYLLIYSFHMPAFIYCMGRFTKPRWKRAGYFLSLYVIFNFLYSLFFVCIGREDVTFSLVYPTWITWFLLAAVFYTLISFLLPKELPRNKKLVIFIFSVILALAAGFLPFVGEAFTLSRAIVFLPFFLAGKFGLISDRKGWWISLLSLFVGLALFMFYLFTGSGNYEALYMYTGYAESHSSWLVRLTLLLIAFCLIRFFIGCMPDRKVPIITDIGKHTLFIFLGHGFVIKLIYEFYEPVYPVFFSLLASFLVVFVLYVLARLLEKVKTIKPSLFLSRLLK